MTSDQFENHSISLDSILSDPSASYWLKDTLRSAITRDPVDAANDAETLAQVLRAYCDKLTRQAQSGERA